MAKVNISNTTIAAGVILFLLFFYVYQRIQIFRTGYKIRTVERAAAAELKDNSFLNLRISELVSPERISEEVKRLGLDLMPPKEKQIIRVK